MATAKAAATAAKAEPEETPEENTEPELFEDEQPTTVELQGEGGSVFTFDLPLSKEIQAQVNKKVLRPPNPPAAKSSGE